MISSYPPTLRALRPFWLPAAVIARVPVMLRSRKNDIVLFQRELISTLVTLEPLFKRPRIFDVDDAIHLSQWGRSIERVARSCDMILCGNSYLADRFSTWNKKVRILPTGVDTRYFKPASARVVNERQALGWIGTSSNLKYLYAIEKALGRVLELRRDAKMVVVCDRPPSFQAIAPERVRFVRWSPEVELKAIQEFAVGIMPLEDTDWARGKCSFKLLQYYACGIPAVASPVGMNGEVLAGAEAGLASTTLDGWVDCLLQLLDHPDDARRRGMAGRELVEREFSLDVIVPRMAAYLREVAAA